MNEIQKALFSLRDERYRAFLCPLIPTVARSRVIGVRAPQLKRLAASLKNSEAAKELIAQAVYEYHEEAMLAAYLLTATKDYAKLLAALELFLPKVDNWAVCDSLRPKIKKENKTNFLSYLRRCLASDHPYTVRFGMEMLMVHYLGEDFSPIHLQWVADAAREHYYVKMMQAWYFATALAEQYDKALEVVRSGRLDAFTHNKTIQKARESTRLSREQKALLQTLKRKT